ncbi:chemotaxis protein CheB [Flexithrix dorotheae]|uniref:chemotaxis protein CheB n=1 Tax=Flexithrix dorotheae TaxID=70993 RepID=UPI00037F74F3|nr:chemotaxis protein CheB [Flexithrix dorotheae]
MSSKSKNFYIVGIGASAGGLEPIQKLFDRIPRYSGAAYIIIQHLSPDFVSLMDELLSKHTTIEVTTAVHDEIIRPNHVYLIPRGKILTISNNKFVITEKEKNTITLPIDIFFHSLGKNLKDRAIGIILSGSGTDGSRGIRTINEEGGIVLVQDPDSAQFDGMPNAAIATNLYDFLGNPTQLTEQLQKICGDNKYHLPLGSEVEFGGQYHKAYNNILSNVYAQKNLDFRHYKPATLERRITKRLKLVGLKSLAEYADYMQSNPEENEILAKEFLIHVTKFFRDREAFEVIQHQVIPQLFKNPDKIIRIWVAGCSTGEEAYTFAAILHEFCTINHLKQDFKIFATDLSKNAITKAGTGRFGTHIESDIPHALLNKYFFKIGDHYEVAKELRERIVFAHHNLLKDPPFINMDLISSRNLLIYLDKYAQENIIEKFTYALNPNGFLFLGPSESIMNMGNEYNIFDSRWRIFRLKSVRKKRVLPFNLKVHEQEYRERDLDFHSIKKEEPLHVKTYPGDLNERFGELILDHYAPTCMIVNKELEILQSVGDMDEFLVFPRSISQFNLSKVLPNDVLVIFKDGIKKVLKDNITYDYKEVPFFKRDRSFKLDIRFIPKWFHSTSEKLVLIEFLTKTDENNEIVSNFFSKDKYDETREQNLELELLETKDLLKTTQEKYETANEELQATNEELMSSNEEMQSTNEELQSVNEELYTVNSELNAKVTELTELNNDINNLLSSTDIGTIFLDIELKIRKFTPAINHHFNLVHSDKGRPIYHFATHFGFNKFKDELSHVLETSSPTQHEITNEKGRHYLMKINPFFTSTQEVKGIVISFIDIEKVKKLQTNEKRLKILTETAPVMKWLVNEKKHFHFFNNAWLDFTGKEISDVEGQQWFELIHPDDFEKSLKIFDEGFEKKEKFEVVYRLRKKGGNYKWMLNKAVPYFHSSGILEGFVGICIDITDRIKAEEKLKKSQRKYRSLYKKTPVMMHSIGSDGKIISASEYWLEKMGYQEEEVIGKYSTEFLSKRSAEYAKITLPEYFKKGYCTDIPYEFIKKNGETMDVLLSAIAEKDSTGKFLRSVAVIKDVTLENQTKEKLKLINEVAEIGTWEWNFEDNKLTWDKHMYKIFNQNENYPITIEKFMDLINPDKDKSIEKKIVATFKNEEKFSLNFKIGGAGENDQVNLRGKAYKKGNVSSNGHIIGICFRNTGSSLT